MLPLVALHPGWKTLSTGTSGATGTGLMVTTLTGEMHPAALVTVILCCPGSTLLKILDVCPGSPSMLYVIPAEGAVTVIVAVVEVQVVCTIDTVGCAGVDGPGLIT